RFTSSITRTRKSTHWAHAASAKSAWPASPPRSPMRCTTPLEFACASFRSELRHCCRKSRLGLFDSSTFSALPPHIERRLKRTVGVDVIRLGPFPIREENLVHAGPIAPIALGAGRATAAQPLGDDPLVHPVTLGRAVF